MSKEFIEDRNNSRGLADANKQEEQLAYFTQSRIANDFITPEYIQTWAARNYETSDYFLNYVKSVFKTLNFLTFVKYLRFPIPSSKLIQNKVIPDLRRVFEAEDSNFDYNVDGVDAAIFLPDLEADEFNEMMFDALMFHHNSIIVTDLDPDVPNSPIRYLVQINNVVSIDVSKDEIKAIAFGAKINVDGVQVSGWLYIDSKRYAFYNRDLELLAEKPHDLGYTPAHFISPQRFSDDPIVRKSLFSYIREELEEYTFLKTLQKMTEPNGAIPITTVLESEDKGANPDFNGEAMEPGTGEAMTSQRASIQRTVVPNSHGILQTGTSIKVPGQVKADGSIDMEVVKSFVNFHFMPVESLKNIDERIRNIASSIINTLVGGATELNEEAKNEMQVRKSMIALENTLTQLSHNLSRIRNLADTDYLSLRYGPMRVNEVTTFYGSDWFLETEAELFTSFNAAPNTIERKNIILRINQSKYKNNAEKLSRQVILYNLMPYVSDKDFDTAINQRAVDPVTFQYQTRFNYWVQQFEAMYGDVVVFFNDMETETNAIKFTVINNLILKLIEDGNLEVENVRRERPLLYEGGSDPKLESDGEDDRVSLSKQVPKVL